MFVTLSIVQAGLKGAPVGVLVLVTVDDLDMDGAPSLLIQLAQRSKLDGTVRRSISGATKDQPESCKAQFHSVKTAMRGKH
jgi:hypothetical protein